MTTRPCLAQVGRRKLHAVLAINVNRGALALAVGEARESLRLAP